MLFQNSDTILIKATNSNITDVQYKINTQIWCKIPRKTECYKLHSMAIQDTKF